MRQVSEHRSAPKRSLAQALITPTGQSPYTDTYVYNGDGAPYELLRQKAGVTSRYWYELDGQGNVVALTDSTGKVVDRYAYDAWGEPTSDNTLNEQVPQQLRYRGYWYDEYLSWYWVSTRYYDPEIARWMQPDPSQADGVRTYVYVGDDPLDFTDPSGLSGSTVEVDGITYLLERTGAVAGTAVALVGGAAELIPPVIVVSGVSYLVFTEFNTATIDTQYAAAYATPVGYTGIGATAPLEGNTVSLPTTIKVPMTLQARRRVERPKQGVFNADQQALIELAKRAQQTGVTKQEAEILLEWGRELGIPVQDHTDPTDAKHHHDIPHMRIGPVNHIPVRM